MTPYSRSEVQGLLLSAYRGWRHASDLFFVLREPRDTAAALRWLAELVPRVTFGDETRSAANLNVAITASGLKALGASDEALASFSPAFLEGMHSQRRSRILGDDDESNRPSGWIWGQGEGERRVDLVLLLFHRTEEGHARQVEEQKQAAERAGLRLVHELPLQTLPETRAEMHEPFGFADGLSQPYFDGIKGADALGDDAYRLHHVEVGEFVLGYKNGYGETTTVPWLLPADTADSFGRDGSYLVLRQLQQDVAGFWDHFRKQAGTADPLAVERLAAKAVGRWRNGCPVSEHPDAPGPDRIEDADENHFSFRARDPFGQSCPLGAHIRRSNPRDSFDGDRDVILRQVNHHRLLRRGRAYGPRIEDAQRFTDDGQERGLVFSCLNGNIERQFEFVQHTWCNDASFHGLHGEVDPVIGAQPAEGGSYSIQGWPLRGRLAGIPRFVKVRGGAYFFLPSRAGLVQLAQSQEA